MTHFALPWFVLLASRAEETHRVWGRFDNDRSGVSNGNVLIIIGVIALLLLIVGVVRSVAARRSTKTYSSDNPAKLFRELCASHGLKSANRRLLKRLAEACGVTNSAMLFLEPQHFETQSLPPDLKSSATELRQLRETLFR
jgi:hypothetical protein